MIAIFFVLLRILMSLDERLFQIQGGVDYMYYFAEVEIGNPK